MSIRHALQASLDYRWKRLLGAVKRTFSLGISPEIRTYMSMQKDNLGNSKLYQGGKFWKKINGEFRDFLWAGALQDLRNEYFNRRFSGPNPSSRQVWRALLWVYYQKLLEIDNEGFLKIASEPSAGGTEDQEIIDGRPMSLDFLQSIEEYYRIKEAWQLAGLRDKPKLVVELGGGYGRLAYIFRQMNPECTYVILDLPEALICSASWLKMVLPSGDLVPYFESRQLTKITRDTLLSNRVWTLGAHQMELIQNKSIDIFVNIYSFAEMPETVIQNYFAQIDRITNNLFYSKQRKVELNQVDGLTVNQETYPVYAHWKLLFFRTTLLYEAFFESAYGIKG